MVDFKQIAHYQFCEEPLEPEEASNQLKWMSMNHVAQNESQQLDIDTRVS